MCSSFLCDMCDVAENILLRCDLHALEEEDEESSAPWNAQGANGWKHYGVLLTNLTNAVDVQELPRQVG